MSMKLDASIAASGTKFLIFPQPRFIPFFEEPEVVRVTLPPSQIQPGPEDDRMYVLDAVNKTPYGSFNQRPFSGIANSPVQPGVDGHYDHLDINSREFSAATMYATVRRVLDIWEDYFGRRIEWHFRMQFEKMELIPLINWNNAQSGWGFLEFGFGSTEIGTLDTTKPYCQNFDVLAHELGHSIVFAEVGFPSSGTSTDEYGGFHESAGDLVALVSSLHFDKVVDRLLINTKGNLFTKNELNRIGELSESRQIREAFNNETMSTVRDQGPHSLSLPLTGAIFDVFVEVFQKELVNAALISQDLATRSFNSQNSATDDVIQSEFASAYVGNEQAFKQALLQARDYLGRLLAHAWEQLSANNLSYVKVGLQLMDSDLSISGGLHQNTIRESFLWREINFSLNAPIFQVRRLNDCGFL